MGFALRIKIGNIQFKGQRAKGKVSVMSSLVIFRDSKILLLTKMSI
jgi:hypothetical protein